MSKDEDGKYDDHLSLARDIENMKIRGAGKIARMGAHALALFAMYYSGKREDYYGELLEAANIIFHTRPTAVSLENALLLVLNSVDPEGELEAMRRETEESAHKFISEAKRSLSELSRIGAELIRDGATVHTHCNSTAVIRSIIRAAEDGKKVTVHSTESRPRYQGRITARELAGSGIEVKMLVDSAARLYMDDVDLVMVGADTISADGSLFNKIGTWQIALAARDCGVPFYSCAETFKFSPRTLSGLDTTIEMRAEEEVADPAEFPNVKILNPAFDHTPRDLIAGIATEKGVVKPGEAKNVIENMFRGKRTDFFY